MPTSQTFSLFRVIQSRSRVFYLILVSLAFIRSFTGIGILMMINLTLQGKKIEFIPIDNYLAYVLLILLSFVSTGLFQNYMAKLTNNMMFDLEMSIIGKIRRASYESFEKLGYQKVFASIGDSRSLANVPAVFVNFINSIITVVCSLGYLFWTSFWGGAVVFGLMVLLFCIYIYRDGAIKKDLNKIRDLQDMYYTYLRELFVGFKQIRISTTRNNNLFHNYILENKNRSKQLSIKTARQYLVNELTGVYSWYLVLGIIMFPLPFFFNMDLAQVATFITSVLFMIAPISNLVMFWPMYNSFKIALDRINKINKSLEDVVQDMEETSIDVREFESVRFENVSYKYDQDELSTFKMEIDNMTIQKGEVVFIVGGNGSGKTTFINILLGLCRPAQGQVYINGKEYSWKEYSAFSNSMAAVFTDQYLFTNNYDDYEIMEDDETLKYYRKLTRMDGILKIDEKGKRVGTKLSKGQQKRLALLLSLMEDKPIVILDEWAAEQDPANRRYFYMELLQILKNSGKTVVAISHDDDFYHVADRVIKFDLGNIVSGNTSVKAAMQEESTGDNGVRV